MANVGDCKDMELETNPDQEYSLNQIVPSVTQEGKYYYAAVEDNSLGRLSPQQALQSDHPKIVLFKL